MTLDNLICGIIGSIISTIIITIATKMYLGVSNFQGLKGSIRLLRDCYRGGVINIFPNRKTYVQHKDHGTASQYISTRCTDRLIYVGYWLAHGTEMGDIIDMLKKLILDKKDVEVVLLNPKNNNLVREIADYMKIDTLEMKQRIKTSLSKLSKLKRELPDKQSEHFQIKVHNIPINASAFIIDYNNQKMRILVDYKIYNHESDKSYGIEFADTNKIVTKNLLDAYLQICQNSNKYEPEIKGEKKSTDET